jgi:hypothetical protein
LTSLSPAQRDRLHRIFDLVLDAQLAPGQDINGKFDQSGQFSVEIFPACFEQAYHVDQVTPFEVAESIGQMVVAARREGAADVLKLAIAN